MTSPTLKFCRRLHSAPHGLEAWRKIQNLQNDWIISGIHVQRRTTTKSGSDVHDQAANVDGTATSGRLIDNPLPLLRKIFEGVPVQDTHASLQYATGILAKAISGNNAVPSVRGWAQNDEGIQVDQATCEAESILKLLTIFLEDNLHNRKARASLPELLLLLVRLRIPTHPKFEAILIQYLARGKLPAPSPDAWYDTAIIATVADNGLGPVPSATTARDVVAAPVAPPPPTAFRLALAMASLPIASHEAWQVLSQHHMLSPPTAPLLDFLSPDQLTQLAAAFARTNYHPVEVFSAISDRLLPNVHALTPAALARALHSFASLRHHDPPLYTALAQEALHRLQPYDSGTDAAAGGVVPAVVDGGGSGGLLSLAGVALFGASASRRRKSPDRFPRTTPVFRLEDLWRLAAAAVVHSSDGEAAAVWRYGGLEDTVGGSSRCEEGLGGVLLTAVAEVAEAVVVERVGLAVGLGAVDRDAAESVPEAEVPLNGNSSSGSSGIGSSSCGSNGGYSSFNSIRPNLSTRYNRHSNSSSRTCSSNSHNYRVAELLDPVMGLLGALVTGGGVGPATSTPGRVARAIAVRHLVPALPHLEPYMTPSQLVMLLAAAAPGSAAALRQTAHPYPLPPPSSLSSLTSSTDEEANGAPTDSDALTAVAAALVRRTDSQIFSDTRHLLSAWHVLAAAVVAGAPGSNDPQLVRHLMTPVCSAVVRHQTHMRSVPEATRFLVSCAILSVYDRPALDVVGARLAVALNGGGVNGSGRSGPLSGPTLAQIGWALGQLGYDNSELLAALQSQALACSAPHRDTAPHIMTSSHSMYSSRPPQPIRQTRQPLSGGDSNSDAEADWAASAVQPTYTSGSGGGGRRSCPPLGPLELGDVMWGLVVNRYRSNEGAELRELYLRAATAAPSRPAPIDDPRWLALVRVHLLLLLGWGGGLGPGAGRLRSDWFNTLTYVWGQQAVSQNEHLAAPAGTPPPHDPSATAFYQSLVTTVQELLTHSDASSSGSGRRGAVQWRLNAPYVWRMLRPSSDIRLTLPLLIQQAAVPRAPWRDGGGRSGGAGGDWLVALDPIYDSDEARTPSVATAASAAPAMHASTQGQSPQSAPRRGTARGLQDGYQHESGLGAGGSVSEGHLLGPARWRQLVLRQLGVVIRQVRQVEWEVAKPTERRAMLQQALKLC